MADDGETLVPMQDANYNVTGLVGKTGGVWQVGERYLYDAYGKPTYLAANFTVLAVQQSAYENTVLYTGRSIDLETQLMYYRTRITHFDLGRFTNEDPAAADINAYRYCGNSPARGLDPYGLWTVTRRSNAERAQVCGDADDNIASLAKTIRLDASEFATWLKSEDGLSLPATKSQKLGIRRSFSVPNTLVIGIGNANWLANGYLAYHADSIDDAAQANGLYTVTYAQRHGFPKSAPLLNAFKDPDVWGYAFLGHGYYGFGSNSDGAFVWDKQKDGTDLVTADNLAALRKHKFALAIQFHCFSAWMAWGKNLSSNAKIYDTPSVTMVSLGPITVGYFGTWRGLMDDAV